MHTTTYKGWFIQETFLSECVRPASVQNGVQVQSPTGEITPVKSVHAAKCFITLSQQTPA